MRHLVIRQVRTITTSSICSVEPVAEEEDAVVTTVEAITHVVAEAMEEKLTPSMMVPTSMETTEVDTTTEVAEEAITMMQKTVKAYSLEAVEAEEGTTAIPKITKVTS